MESLQSTSSEANINQMEIEEKLHAGYAVIFNNDSFHSSLGHLNRKGIANDVAELINTFKHFNIKVHVKKDFTLKEINKEVKRLQGFNFRPYECFIIVILSHEKENNVLYAQNFHYNLNETIINPIVNANSTLKGKPKIFVIQACKGSMKPINLIKADAVASMQVPTISDMYFAFSTYEGVLHKCSPSIGGIFIQKFCEMLMKYGLMEVITTIMERVTDELLKENKKEVPIMVVTTLTKPFRFGDIGIGLTKKIEIDDDKGSSKNLQMKNDLKHSKTQDKLMQLVHEGNIEEFLKNFKERNYYNLRFDRIYFQFYEVNMKFLKEVMPKLQILSINRCIISEYQLLSILQNTKNLKILKIGNIKTWDWKLDDTLFLGIL